MSDRLTVVVPCHDVAAELPTTLATLERAVDERVDVLFVDDASTDATGDLLRAAARRIPRARVETTDRNRGVSAARNLGLRASDTAYVTLLDGDDWVSPGWYAYLLDAIVAARTDFVRTDHIEADGRHRLLRRIPDRHRRGRTGSPREAILPVDARTAIDVPYSWAGAYHRSLVDAGLLDFPDLAVAEDRPWIWRLFLGAESFTIPDGAGVHYRLNRAASLTRRADSRQLDFVRAMELTLATVRADRDAERFVPKAVRRQLELTLHHLGRMDRFTPGVAATFRRLLAESIAGLPADERDPVMESLPTESCERLHRLIAQEAR